MLKDNVPVTNSNSQWLKHPELPVLSLLFAMAEWQWPLKVVDSFGGGVAKALLDRLDLPTSNTPPCNIVTAFVMATAFGQIVSLAPIKTTSL